MGLPTGVFSHPSAGRLRVVFNASFLYNDAEVGEPPGGNGLFLRCYVGDGASIKVGMLSYVTQSLVIELPYAGGYVMVPVGMSLHLVVDNGLGPTEMTAQNLLISCHLLQGAA